MALASAIITSARYDLMDEDSIQYSDAMLLDYLNRSVTVLDQVLGSIDSDWTFSESERTLAATENYVALPDDFGVMVRKDTGKPVSIGSGYDEVEKVQASDIYYYRETSTPGMPNYYSEQALNLIFDRVADQEYTVYIRYHAVTGALVATDSMPYNGEFNEALIKAIVILAKNRNEYSVAGDGALHSYFISSALGKITARNAQPRIKLGF